MNNCVLMGLYRTHTIIAYKMAIKIRKPRRIIGYGYSKLITLPLIWLSHHNLTKKGLIEMEIDDQNRLILIPYKEVKE